jgi:hypothetical protein
MTEIAYNNSPTEIIRIMVDNIVYKSEVSFNVENMTVEDKSTGLINFKNVMKLSFLCKTCKSEVDRGLTQCSSCLS